MISPDETAVPEFTQAGGLDWPTLAAMSHAAATAAGPPGRLYSNVRPMNVRIDQSDIDVAKALGGGNVSEGLRVALKLIAQALNSPASQAGA